MRSTFLSLVLRHPRTWVSYLGVMTLLILAADPILAQETTADVGAENVGAENASIDASADASTDTGAIAIDHENSDRSSGVSGDSGVSGVGESGQVSDVDDTSWPRIVLWWLNPQ